MCPCPQSRIDRTLDEALNVLAWEAIVLLYAVIVVAPIALVASAAYFGARPPPARERPSAGGVVGRTSETL